MAKRHQHIDSSLDDLLQDTGELAEVNAVAIKRVFAWEIAQKMEAEIDILSPLKEWEDVNVDRTGSTTV